MQAIIESQPKNWTFPFFTIWTGQSISLFGSSLVQFALVWWLTRETGSATILAMATLLSMLPKIMLGAFVGTLIDRWNRRLVLIFSDAGIALSTVGLIILFVTGYVQVWHIYAIMLIRSLGETFHFPTMQASTTLMVPEKHLSRVAGINQTLQGLVNVAAPPLGAVLISLLATELVLSIDILTASLAVIPLLFIPIPQPERLQESGSVESIQTSFWQDLREGFEYVVSWPGLMAVLALAIIVNFLLSPAGALSPILVTRHFGGGAIELGWLESSWGFGVIAGGLLLSVWGGFKKKIITSLLGIIGIGLGILVVGLAPANLFSLAIIGLFISGSMNPIANGPLMALLQTKVRPDMQGRVMALTMSAASAMMPISLMIAGPISDRLGIRVWYWFGGVTCLLIGMAAFFVPAIINIENKNEDDISNPAMVMAEGLAD
ncbi:MAG: MFS transporter [Anaerolineales bacterium]|nr:MFS transporter [Anaerolineales bacterium]